MMEGKLMDMNKQMAILLCALLLLELPALPLCGAANPGVQLGVTADAGTIPAWGSCNLTARLTQDGAPLGMSTSPGKCRTASRSETFQAPIARDRPPFRTRQLSLPAIARPERSP